MSKRKGKHAPVEEPPAEDQQADPAGPEGDPDAGGAVDDADELTKLRARVQELEDKNLRLVAEQQNQQKRTQRDHEQSLRYAEASFARDLLVILDDLERTQESARTATDVEAVADGVRIVYEHFLKVLSQHGIEQIQAVGEPFDPSFHEALMQQPCPDCPAGTVAQELARGYKMHDRVLRPTRVMVSAGPATGDAERGQE